MNAPVGPGTEFGGLSKGQIEREARKQAFVHCKQLRDPIEKPIPQSVDEMTPERREVWERFVVRAVERGIDKVPVPQWEGSSAKLLFDVDGQPHYMSDNVHALGRTRPKRKQGKGAKAKARKKSVVKHGKNRMRWASASEWRQADGDFGWSGEDCETNTVPVEGQALVDWVSRTWPLRFFDASDGLHYEWCDQRRAYYAEEW